MTELSKKLALVIKRSSLSYAEQVACIAAIETIHTNWNAALANDIEHRFGLVALTTLKDNK